MGPRKGNDMEEVWKAVPVAGFEHKYEVSNTGFVRNVKTGLILTPMRTGCKRPGAQRSKVRFRTTPRVDCDVAHLVLEAFVGPRPTGCVVLHRDDDSANNALDNITWGTHKDNAIDAAMKRRGGNQVITVEAACEIRRLRNSGILGRLVAEQFGISQQRVCDIYKGRTALL
jgi:hypothetical protein